MAQVTDCGCEADAMVNFILGGRGYVGSAYARLMDRLGLEHVVLTRDNYADHAGQACDVFINANGNSKKFLADSDPKGEFNASVNSVVASLEDFKSKRYVLLSTGDVYPQQDRPELTVESQAIDTRRVSRYGLHKYIAEEIVRAVHPSWLVLRMGGFVGPGMKKNAIYDILNGPQVWLHCDSELQFISTDRAAELIWAVVEKGVVNETINIGAEGVVRIGDIHNRVNSSIPFTTNPRKVRFELDLGKFRGILGPLPKSIDEVDRFLGKLGY